MAATSHKIGTIFLVGAVALLIVTNITTPVVKSVSLLRIDMNNSTDAPQHPVLSLGTYGHCLTHNITASGGSGGAGDRCSPMQLGYNAISVVGEVAGLQFTSAALDTGRAAARLTVLQPVTVGTSALAVVLSLGAGGSRSCLATLMSMAAFCSALILLVANFIVLNMIRSGVNETPAAHATASFGTAMWTLVAATALLLLGTLVSLTACCGGRGRRRRDRRYSKEDDYSP